MMSPPASAFATSITHARVHRCNRCLRRITHQTLAALTTGILLAGCQSVAPVNAPDNHVQVIAPASSEEFADSQGTTETTTGTDNNASNTLAYQRSIETPWTEIIHTQFEQARRLVEHDLDVDLQQVQLLLVDDQPINAEVARETRRLVNEHFGLSTFSEQFLDKVMKNQSGTYAALFSSRLKAVMVSRSMLSSYENSLVADPDVRNAALLTLLIHELVHAADDQRYRIHENRALNFRASFAQSATFEGHAQWVTRRICAAYGCTSGLDALDKFMFSRESKPNQHTQPVEAISRNVLEYSYIEGERFVTHLAKRPNGRQLIDTLLAAPPFDPIQILDPATFPNSAREHRNQRLINASLNIDHPWVKGRWIGVETSPLKGVNLRADPSRRQAAVDGFTRLIQAMVAMQLYDRDSPDANPMEVTLLHAESAHTAELFASTLHDNSQIADATINNEPLRINTGAGHEQSQMNVHLYRTQLNNDTPYRTTVAVSGPYVVQIAGVLPASTSGIANNATAMDDYAIRVLLNLQLNR